MTRNAVPSLMQLEDRTAPAAFRWNPERDGNALWSTIANWDSKASVEEPWQDATAIPTGRDTAEFVAIQHGGFTLSSACIVDNDTYVRGVRIDQSYLSSLLLRNDLHITDSKSSPYLSMQSDSAVISGDVVDGAVVNQGQLYIGGTGSLPANMYWGAGKLLYVTVHVSHGSTMLVDGASPKNMGSAIFHINGKLDWDWGNVTVRAAPVDASAIEVHVSGEFSIGAGGYSWGAGTNLRTSNYGLVRKYDPGVAHLGGDYFTSGTTRVEADTLLHGGKAEQTGGVYELWAGTTTKVTGPDGLRIRNGGIIGLGKVHSDLKLGYTDAEAALAPGVAAAVTPTITPGLYNVLGTLTIAGTFDMLSGGASMSITMDKTGTTSQVAVTGSATLKGTLYMNVSNDYMPPPGVRKTFLTAAGIGGDFSATRLSGLEVGFWPNPDPDPVNPLWDVTWEFEGGAKTYDVVAVGYRTY